MRQALDALARAARSEAPIIMRVEAGAPTTELARWVHDNSPRRDGAFVRLSCPSMNGWPAEVFDLADGTLFLEEIGDIAADRQSELSRALDGLGRRGSVRIVSSSRRDLEEAVARGSFRRDLYFRLNVVDVRVPPLRERREDVIPMAVRLVETLSVDLARRAPRLSESAASLLSNHPWPANERELENILERALLVTSGDWIDAAALKQLSVADIDGRPHVGGDFTLRAIEREHIVRVTARVPSPLSAARILGIAKTTLWRRLRRHERVAGAITERDRAR
jgi:NtrC-family two-component system response regulator AlgB